MRRNKSEKHLQTFPLNEHEKCNKRSCDLHFEPCDERSLRNRRSERKVLTYNKSKRGETETLWLPRKYAYLFGLISLH